MGYNTCLMICNDTVRDMADDPDAGSKVYTAVRDCVNEPVDISGSGPNCSSGVAIGCEHADVPNHRACSSRAGLRSGAT